MSELLRVGDTGTIVYVDVQDGGVSLDTLLDSFTVRMVRLRRPGTTALLEVPDVPVAVDAHDGIKKLQMVTGPAGDFELTEADIGPWYGEAVIGDGGHQWTSDSSLLFHVDHALR